MRRVFWKNLIAPVAPSRRLEPGTTGTIGVLLDGLGATELGGELLHAAGGIDDALLAGVGGVRVHGDVTNDNEVFHAVDGLFATGLEGGLGQELLAGANVEEADVVERGMAFGFHDDKFLVVMKISPGALCSGGWSC